MCAEQTARQTTWSKLGALGTQAPYLSSLVLNCPSSPSTSGMNFLWLWTAWPKLVVINLCGSLLSSKRHSVRRAVAATEHLVRNACQALPQRACKYVYELCARIWFEVRISNTVRRTINQTNLIVLRGHSLAHSLVHFCHFTNSEHRLS